jgi:uncharacterized protein YjaZ
MNSGKKGIIYKRKRWWKENFTSEKEINYWYKAQSMLNSVDDADKNPWCFGDPRNGIPLWGGYAFGYKLVKSFAEENSLKTVQDLLFIEPMEIIDAYRRRVIPND